MKMAKKFALVVVASAFAAGALGGCGKEESSTEKKPDAAAEKKSEPAPEKPK
jgi:hypothetical protein